MYLNQKNYETHFFTNAEDCRNAVKNKQPDLILLDVMLPGISGFELTRELRKQYKAIELPILLLTAKSLNENLAQGLNSGANDYLPKPFSRDQLLIHIENLLQFSKMHSTFKEKIQKLDHDFLKQKETIFSDFHDQIGSRLTDMRIVLDKLSKTELYPFESLENLKLSINEIEATLRQKLQRIDDLLKIEQNYLEGIHLHLLARYHNAGKKMRFEYDQKSIDFFADTASDSIKSSLLSIFEEVTTNDLKYGKDSMVSAYNITLNNSEIDIRFVAATGYRLSGSPKGKGTGTIMMRIMALNGRVNQFFEDETYNLQINLSLNNV